MNCAINQLLISRILLWLSGAAYRLGNLLSIIIGILHMAAIIAAGFELPQVECRRLVYLLFFGAYFDAD